jgi:hypothetical protein
MKSTLKWCFILLILSAVVLSSACNSNTQDNGTPGVSQYEEKKKSDEQKQADEQKNQLGENGYIPGKELKRPDMVTGNTLYLSDGKGSISVHVGEKVWLVKLYIIEYQDDKEYLWKSDDTSVAEAANGMVAGIAPGTTHIHCTDRDGNLIADLTVTVLASQTSRLEKTIKLDGEVYYGALTIKDNFIYIGTSVGINKTRPEHFYFYKMDMDLNVIWKYDLGKFGVRGSAVLDSKGNIYFTAEDFGGEVPPEQSNALLMNKNIHIGIYLYSLKNSGTFRFSKEITGKPGNGPGGMAYHIGMLNCAMDKDDTLYIADSGLQAYDTEGNLKWRYPGDDADAVTRSSPVFDNAGNLYVFMGSVLFRFDAGSNGTPAWQIPLGSGWMNISPPSFNADFTRIYQPNYETVYCVDTTTGEKVWEFTPPGIKGEFRANAAVDTNGNVYIGTKADRDSTLFAIKADGSGLLWSILVGGDLYCSPVLGDDGLVYVGSEPSIIGAFYAIEKDTGKIVWSMGETYNNDGTGYGGIGWTSLRIADGYVYTPKCKIKVDANNYLPGAGWPTLRGSNDDSGSRK